MNPDTRDVRSAAGRPPRYTVCTSTTHPSNPTIGDRLYETDTGMDLIYQGATVGWQMPWGMAWGYINSFTTTSFSQAVTSATLVDLTGFTITYTALANRRYKITASGLLIVESVSSGTAKCFITDGATAPANIKALIGESALSSAAPGTRQTVGGIYVANGLSAGSTTFKLEASASAGTSTFTVDSSSTAILMVEDIGPNGNPS